MNVLKAEDERKGLVLGYSLLLFFIGVSVWSLTQVSSEIHQGEVYRILYLHVPSAFAAFFASFLLFLCSLWNLRKPRHPALLYGKASAEVGLLFTAVTLITGSLWGKPTWGVWWTWDARLTTTLILALLYGGYLLLWSAIPAGALRAKVSAVLGILIFADVPLIYKSVTWWRTLHQPPSLLRSDGPTMAREILLHLVLCIVVTLLVALWLIWQRAINLALKEQVDYASYGQLLKEENRG